jgi:acetyl esterase/lipase
VAIAPLQRLDAKLGDVWIFLAAVDFNQLRKDETLEIDCLARGGAPAQDGGAAIAPAYAAPLHRANFAGLPPARVEVAEFDPLLDEGRQYAHALEAAGVPVEMREVKGAIHGYDLVAGSPIAAAVFAERMDAIRRFLGAA